MPKSVFTDAYHQMRVNLIALRRASGVSQEELAARLGKKQPFVSRIERGERRLDVLEFFVLSRALGVEPTDGYRALIENIPSDVKI